MPYSELCQTFTMKRFASAKACKITKNSLWKNVLHILKKSFHYISGNRTFLYFRKRNFVIFQEKEIWKIFLYFKFEKWKTSTINPQFYFGKMELSSPSLKNFLYFKRELAKPENFTFLFLVRELFQNKCKRKRFLILFFVSAKFSELKYFLVKLMNRFFSFYNISFYIQQAFAFHFLRDFCNVPNHIFIYTKKKSKDEFIRRFKNTTFKF